MADATDESVASDLTKYTIYNPAGVWLSDSNPPYLVVPVPQYLSPSLSSLSSLSSASSFSLTRLFFSSHTFYFSLPLIAQAVRVQLIFRPAGLKVRICPCSSMPSYPAAPICLFISHYIVICLFHPYGFASLSWSVSCLTIISAHSIPACPLLALLSGHSSAWLQFISARFARPVISHMPIPFLTVHPPQFFLIHSDTTSSTIRLTRAVRSNRVRYQLDTTDVHPSQSLSLAFH